MDTSKISKYQSYFTSDERDNWETFSDEEKKDITNRAKEEHIMTLRYSLVEDEGEKVPLHELLLSLSRYIPGYISGVNLHNLYLLLPVISEKEFTWHSKNLFSTEDSGHSPETYCKGNFYAWLASAIAPKGLFEINPWMTEKVIRDEKDFQQIFPKVYNLIRAHVEERLFIRREMLRKELEED